MARPLRFERRQSPSRIRGHYPIMLRTQKLTRADHLGPTLTQHELFRNLPLDPRAMGGGAAHIKSRNVLLAKKRNEKIHFGFRVWNMKPARQCSGTTPADRLKRSMTSGRSFVNQKARARISGFLALVEGCVLPCLFCRRDKRLALHMDGGDGAVQLLGDFRRGMTLPQKGDFVPRNGLLAATLLGSDFFCSFHCGVIRKCFSRVVNRKFKKVAVPPTAFWN